MRSPSRLRIAEISVTRWRRSAGVNLPTGPRSPAPLQPEPPRVRRPRSAVPGARARGFPGRPAAGVLWGVHALTFLEDVNRK